MVNERKYFTSFEDKVEELTLADGTTINALGKGSIELNLPHACLTITNTLLIPSLTSNLLSYAPFLRTNHSLLPLKEERFEVVDKNNKRILEVSYHNGNLVAQQSIEKSFKITKNENKDIINLHKTSSHPSLQYFKKCTLILKYTTSTVSLVNSAKPQKWHSLVIFPKVRKNWNSFILTCAVP
ncbi:hypothetical protein O181_099899 [Austropuccinia psidii MF-1]|uniref:Retrovirus-related Pol polyprotein from transposon TNT 1-94-like beta-barrel domain-containing protein n=1 Tax=Austropuccinia psidii MF-1 TaxID=1389203 RepID=A0A9Q3JE57_9BASI|nr:hypothetical protein [Austropuccinia psidii MF-1]